MKKAWIALVVVLCSCAAQRDFDEGQRLIQNNKTEEGIAKLQEALRADPRNAQYRAALLRERERAVQETLARARTANTQDEAQVLYERALAIDPGHGRARMGLLALERERLHAQLLKEAHEARRNHDMDTATTRLRQVLSENPEHAQARQLQREIAERVSPTRQAPALSAALKKPITIEFRDASLRQVFEAISRTSGVNFVFDREVKTDTRTTLFLRHSTVEAAIEVLAQTNQLEQRVVDANTLMIYPNTPAKVREYQPLVVRTLVLSTADAKTVANTLRTILKTRDVVVDEKLNMIILRDSPEAIRMAEKLAQLHDTPEPEVMLEVEILEIKRSRLLELGVRWPGQLSLSPLPTTSGATLTLNDLSKLNSAHLGATIDAAAIQARQTDTDTNLLANPRIRAKNREKAKILIGDRLPTITSTSTSTGFVSESVNYIDVGLKLDVEPVIYADGEVVIKVALEVSNIVSQVRTQGTLAYQLGTRSASTTLRLKDGENQVLAGLIQDDERSSGNRVPGLGSMPVLGRLFGAQTDEGSKTEIVLSITPRLIRGIQRPGAELAQFDAGTEASLRNRGSESGALPSAAPMSAAAIPDQRAALALPAAQPASLAPAASSNVGAADVGIAPASTYGQGSSGLGQSSQPARMIWQGPSAVQVGDLFSLSLQMQADQVIANLPLTLSFDPRAVQVISVTEGDFMRQGGAQTTFSSRVTEAGHLVVALTRAGGTGGSSASGTVVSLSFRALAPVESARIRVDGVAATGVDGASITVTPPAALNLQVRP